MAVRLMMPATQSPFASTKPFVKRASLRVIGALLIGGIATMFGGAMSAHAGEITAAVVAPLPTVSLSVDGSVTAASYNVTLTNTGSSGTINNGRFVASTSVTGGGPAIYVSAVGASCIIVDGDPTRIDCSVGNLGKDNPKTFTVTFVAPTSGTNIRLDWQAVFDSGTPPGISNGNSGQTDIGLAPRSANLVESAVPVGATVTLFTGSGIATAEDTWVTTVEVPGNGTNTSKAQVSETVTPGGLAGDLTTFSTSALTIPGAFSSAPYLRIFLVRDASTITKRAKISSARIYYTDPANPAPGVTYPYEVLPCSDTTWGALPKPGIPCIKSRKEYSKRTAPTLEWIGDWLFEIWAVDNGKYNN